MNTRYFKISIRIKDCRIFEKLDEFSEMSAIQSWTARRL